jgi:nifR3 family TIM-barrel protein
MSNFWMKLKRPRPYRLAKHGGQAFFALAPMADVTDAAFRRIIAKYGKPDVLWTEFVSADGLASPGREVLKYNLLYTEKERPIVAQLFSSHPDKMRKAAKYCANLGFDGIDINMGCPDKGIEKQGAGAAMMKDMKKAGEIIEAVKDGIKDAKKKIPVSVKTRIGYNKNQINEWIPFLLSCDIDALTIHARTRKEMSNVPARWEHVKEVVDIRNKMKVKTLIIGNGDVRNVAHGRELAKETGCDGIMIGRGIFGNPWLFRSLRLAYIPKSTNISLLRNFSARPSRPAQGFSEYAPSIQEKLKVLVEHAKLFEKLLGKVKNFAIMKKHFKAYINGFPACAGRDGAKELRIKLMETNSAKEVEAIVKEFLKTF